MIYGIISRHKKLAVYPYAVLRSLGIIATMTRREIIDKHVFAVYIKVIKLSP